MARWAYILTTFVFLATWAGAQGPVPSASLNAEDKLRLLKANRTLIDNLVNDGVAMSNASDTVDRAERCRSAARSLVNAIQQAASADDAERVAELTGLFRQVVSDGLLPTINEAKQNVDPQSPKGKQLQQVRDNTAHDLSDVKAAINTSGKLNQSDRVKDAARQLDELANGLK